MEKPRVISFSKFFLKIVFFTMMGWASAFAQTIRIADNNPTHPTGTNIFTTLQAAINAADPGDLVYVQPSLTSYGDVTVDRPITLRGIGFNTGKDIAFTSIVGNIFLSNTVTNATNASGSVIEGIAATSILLGNQTGTFTFTLQNVKISNCSISNTIGNYTGYMPSQNITIQGCAVGYFQFLNSTISQILIYDNLITGGFSFGVQINPYIAYNGCCVAGGGTLTNTIISNNIITQTTQNKFNNTAISGVAITNNNFVAGTDKNGSRFITGQLTDAVVTNNIFYGTTPGSNGAPFERNSFLNNISYASSNDALPPAGSGVGNTGTGNLVSQDPTFVNAVYNVAYSSTMDFTLQSGSPAKNAGSDGTDIGISGGAYPVTTGNVLLKPTGVPVITTFNPAALVPQGQPVQTNIKAKSN